MNHKIGGCVIFYNPGPDALDNIQTYCGNLDFLIVIDNSPDPDPHKAEEVRQLSGNISYKWLGKNEGIAKALNVACDLSIKSGAEWLLTMDQDSRFSNRDLESLKNEIDNAVAEFGAVGIISPCHRVHPETVGLSGKRLVKIKGAMTSGNLLNLDAYIKSGPFEEKLFIDYVDYEYCLRLRKNNYFVIQDNEIWLEHSLGNFEVRDFLGKKVGATHHGVGRRYYITRNRYYTMTKYFAFDPVFFLKGIKNIVYDFFRILFFESEKWPKMKAVWTGLYHGIINRYGKYEGFDPRPRIKEIGHEKSSSG